MKARRFAQICGIARAAISIAADAGNLSFHQGERLAVKPAARGTLACEIVQWVSLMAFAENIILFLFIALLAKSNRRRRMSESVCRHRAAVGSSSR